MRVDARDNQVFHDHAAMRELFRRELMALAPILSGIYGNQGLFVRGHALMPCDLPPHLIGCLTTLSHAKRDQMHGDVRCRAVHLPFANESFNLFVAQHAYEQCDRLQDCIEEIARVLAPEGIALIMGFNPLGTWRPWLAWRTRVARQSLHLHSAQSWRRHLLRERIDTLQIRFPGLLLPRARITSPGAPPGNETRNVFARFGSSWLLLARKRRATLTPMRLRDRNKEFGLQPGLLSGARRARA